jgi:Protein of unknown function (DUF3429)
MANVVALRNAQTLGHLGLLPFFALALLAWLPDTAAFGKIAAARFVQLALVAYAAVILSFLGAVHWGFALSTTGMPHPLLRQSLVWGVIPSLLGWLALLMMFAGVAAWLVFAFLIADLMLVRLMDGALLRQHLARPEGYLELRTRLTAGASLALAVALAASF